MKHQALSSLKDKGKLKKERKKAAVVLGNKVIRIQVSLLQYNLELFAYTRVYFQRI